MGTNERSKYDFLPQFEASQKGSVRIAMLLSLNLDKMPSMSYEDRILAWVDNIVGYLQDGVCWEKFVSWMRGGYPTEVVGNIQELGIREVVAGRVFFYDLISLWPISPMVNRNPKTYGSPEEVASHVIRDLLESIWTRLINSPCRRTIDK